MELGRYETHYATIVRLLSNMLEDMDEAKVRAIVEAAMAEALAARK